jgi:hypothetical protein
MNVFLCLDGAIDEHLAELGKLLETGDDETLVRLACSELPRLCEAWLELLATHRPDADGRCTRCLVSRRWGRRSRLLCEARVILHAHLTASDVVVGR